MERFGPLFEHSPWVAEDAWSDRPFADADELFEALRAAMYAAPRERQLALIRAHPDLAGKAAIEGSLTDSSTREQASAGLDRLTPDEYEAFTRTNTAYRERFGFPFVVCAREHTKESILRVAAERLEHTPRRGGARGAGGDREDRAAAAGGHAVRISYGKLRVPVHRIDGDDVFACEVSVEVLGDNFLPAYTEGDNSDVVATDTMKNFILRESLQLRRHRRSKGCSIHPRAAVHRPPTR